MRKSFKKAIAILLAVLMIACSVPFTAFAAPGDYNIDLQLRFGTLFEDNQVGATSDFWYNIDTSSLTGDSTFDTCSLMSAPVDYDAKNGTLTLKAAKTVPYATGLEMPEIALTEDHQYGVGDVFTVTILAEGITNLAVLQAMIQYSDAIEPFGQYTYKGGALGKTTKTGWGSWSDAQAAYDADTSKKKNGLAWGTLLGDKPMKSFSASTLYGDRINYYDDISEIVQVGDEHLNAVADANYMYTNNVQTNGGDCASCSLDGLLTDPATGEWGYVYEGTAVLTTFAFKIVKEGPITFNMYDPDNNKFAGHFEGGAYARFGDNMSPKDYTTYSVNKCTGAAYDQGPDEVPGSRHITFMGVDVLGNGGTAAPSEYTINFVNAAGETVSTQTVAEGEMPTAPANTAADFDNENHYAYAWPEVAAATADATYTEVKTPTKHTLGAAETVTAPTCTTAGLEKAACSGCAYVLESEIAIDADAHDWVLKTEKQDSTCTEAGKEAVYECKNDATHTKGGETINPKGHTWVDKEVVAPTVKDAGYTLQECSVCQATQKINETEALGVKVTVEDATALGTVSGLAYGENKVAYGDTYTVTATALEGAKFTGWAINGKVVSSDPTYSAVAYSDITVVPMFEEVGKETITVTFYDKYANVLAQFTGTPAEVQASIEAPAAPVYNGYTFTNWSIDESVFKAADKSMSIYAVYEANKDAAGYTVTVPADVTLTLPEGVENGSIPYNTTAVVTAEGAQAWKVGDAYVGYGDTYEFFVGSDIAIEPVFEAVATTDPTVTKVSVNLIEGSHKVAFLATRNVPDGYTLVSTGFVYGKALTDAELDLEKVNQTAASGGKIKVAYASVTGADQFALNYGIKSMTGTATAKAFIVVKSGDQTQVIYSERMEYTY